MKIKSITLFSLMTSPVTDSRPKAAPLWRTGLLAACVELLLQMRNIQWRLRCLRRLTHEVLKKEQDSPFVAL